MIGHFLDGKKGRRDKYGIISTISINKSDLSQIINLCFFFSLFNQLAFKATPFQAFTDSQCFTLFWLNSEIHTWLSAILLFVVSVRTWQNAIKGKGFIPYQDNRETELLAPVPLSVSCIFIFMIFAFVYRHLIIFLESLAILLSLCELEEKQRVGCYLSPFSPFSPFIFLSRHYIVY